MLLPSLVHSNFFEAPEKVIYPVHNGRESYCPLSGMNDSQWAPGESGGDRPHRSTTTLKTFEGGRVVSLEGLVTGLVIICGLRQFALPKWTQPIYKHKIHQTEHPHFEVYGAEQAEHHCKQQRIEITRGKMETFGRSMREMIKGCRSATHADRGWRRSRLDMTWTEERAGPKKRVTWQKRVSLLPTSKQRGSFVHLLGERHAA